MYPYKTNTYRRGGNVTEEAEIETKGPQAKECVEPPEAGRHAMGGVVGGEVEEGRRTPSEPLDEAQSPVDTLISDSLPSEL